MDTVLCDTQSFSLWKCHEVVGKVLGYRKWLSWFSAGGGRGVGVELQELYGEIKGSAKAWMNVGTRTHGEGRGRGPGAQCEAKERRERGRVRGRCRFSAMFRVGTMAKVDASAPTRGGKLQKGRLWVLSSDPPRPPTSPYRRKCRVLPCSCLRLHSSSASQGTVTQGMKVLTSGVPTAPLVSTMIRTTPEAASRAPVATGSAAQ